MPGTRYCCSWLYVGDSRYASYMKKKGRAGTTTVPQRYRNGIPTVKSEEALLALLRLWGRVKRRSSPRLCRHAAGLFISSTWYVPPPLPHRYRHINWTPKNDYSRQTGSCIIVIPQLIGAISTSNKWRHSSRGVHEPKRLISFASTCVQKWGIRNAPARLAHFSKNEKQVSYTNSKFVCPPKTERLF